MPRTFVWHPHARGRRQTPKNEPPTDGQGAHQAGAERHRPLVARCAARSRRSASGTIRTSVVKQDSPSLRGQIKQVRHLVEVTPVEE